MGKSLKDVILYDERHGEVMNSPMPIDTHDDASLIAARLLKPYMAPDDRIISWTCSIGTNFNIMNDREGVYSVDSVMVRNLR